jgi:cell division protein FtsB
VQIKRRVRLGPIIVAASVALAGYVTLSTVFQSHSAERIVQLKSDIAARQKENGELRAEVDELSRKLQALESRPEVLERQIRSDLGVVRNDEVIIAFPGDEK